MLAATMMPEQIAQIAAWGRSVAPKESCGCFVRGALTELPNRSIEDDLACILKEDVEELLRGHENLRREEVMWWHTHPGGFVGPSRTDMQNRVAGFSYLVVTLNADGSHTATAY